LHWTRKKRRASEGWAFGVDILRMLSGDAYRICLCDYESVLPALAEVIGAEYSLGDFGRILAQFEGSSKASAKWEIEGIDCALLVTLERHESYFFAELRGAGTAFARGKQLLWDAYLSAGGNPDAQQRP